MRGRIGRRWKQSKIWLKDEGGSSGEKGMEEGEISLEVEGSETPREQNEKMDEDIRVEGTKR